MSSENPNRIFSFSEFRKRLFVFTLRDKLLNKKFEKHLINVYEYTRDDAIIMVDLFLTECKKIKNSVIFFYFEQPGITFDKFYFPSSFGVPSIEKKLYNIYLERKAWKG